MKTHQETVEPPLPSTLIYKILHKVFICKIISNPKATHCTMNKHVLAYKISETTQFTSIFVSAGYSECTIHPVFPTFMQYTCTLHICMSVHVRV